MQSDSSTFSRKKVTVKPIIVLLPYSKRVSEQSCTDKFDVVS